MNKIRLSLFLCALGVVSATQVACSSSLNEKLFEAVLENDYAQVKRLLQKGADANAVNDKGDTVLYLAALFGNGQAVKQLLQAGADVDAVNDQGNTALHCANNCATVQRLVQAGADVNVANRVGETALHLAAGYAHESAVDRLLQAGADVNAVDVTGDTALHWASNCAKAQRLVQAGADFEALNSQQRSPLVGCGYYRGNVAELIGYMISVGAGIDDLLQSDRSREYLRPHVDFIKYRAAFLRNLLSERQGVYSVLEDLIGQHASFPILEKAVDKMETILLRDLIEDFVGYRIHKGAVGKMEACLQ